MNLIEKILKLATSKNVTEAEIRDCIGKDRFYAILQSKSDLPLGKLKKLSKILNLTDTEKLWLISDSSEMPKYEKKVGIDIVINEIGSLKQEIAELREEIKAAPKPSSEESNSPQAGVERNLAQKLKKPAPS